MSSGLTFECAFSTHHLGYITHYLGYIQITPMIALGAIAERGRVAPALVFAFVWSTLVYDPIAVSTLVQLPQRVLPIRHITKRRMWLVL
jgi:ammonia channel protein AmtB